MELHSELGKLRNNYSSNYIGEQIKLVQVYYDKNPDKKTMHIEEAKTVCTETERYMRFFLCDGKPEEDSDEWYAKRWLVIAFNLRQGA